MRIYVSGVVSLALRKVLLLAVFVVVVNGLITPSASAQAKGYLGVVAGMSVPNYEDTTARPAHGLLGGMRLDGELGIGAYYLGSSKVENMSGIDTRFNYSLYGIEGSFHFEGVADGAFLGVRVGTTKLSVGSDINTSPTHFGLVFGFDKFLSDNFSVGVEGSWISVESSSRQSVELKNFTLLDFNAAVKMWF